MARPERSESSTAVLDDFSSALPDPEARERAADPLSRMDLDATDRMYVVEEGDTLSSIARKFYGSAASRGRILAANWRIIRDPFVIEPGWRLRIPY